ncbi:hypothetical protein LIER_16161 [Lithospermum erythrorhizon]|uniref:Reverse transcriptase domain-containing protein n=1 Tax=Lithospermum erythrorhizon TaxID=34254 RepID=A0AAV3Q604_LITER
MIDYRPISLCNIVAKIIGRVLTNRLRSVLMGIISEYQSAFLPGHIISDNILIAHEILYYTNHRVGTKNPILALKLDMSKAANRSESREVLLILGDYEEALGQKINIAKSSVSFDKITGPSTKREVVELLGMKEVADHDKYLGLPSYIGRLKRRWRVDDGKSIDMWTEYWVPRTTDFFRRGERGDRPRCVSQLICNGEWLKEEVVKCMAEEDVRRVLSISLSRSGGANRLMWIHTRCGNYITCSGYKTAPSYEAGR